MLPRFTELEARYGSLSRGVLAERRKAASNAEQPPLFRTLKGGLGTLVESLEAAAGRSVEFLRSRAETIERTENGFRIHAGGDWLTCRSVVMACEAHNAAPLVIGLDAGLAQLLDGIPYSSSMILALAFPVRGFSKRSRRLWLPGAQARAPAPGGMYVGEHQVFLSRAGGQ